MNYRLVTYWVVVGVFLVSCLVAVLGLVGAFKIDATLLKWLAGVLLTDSAACLYALFRQFDFRGDENPKQAEAIANLAQENAETKAQYEQAISEQLQVNQRLLESVAQKDAEIASLRFDVSRIQEIFTTKPANLTPPKPMKIDPYSN